MEQVRDDYLNREEGEQTDELDAGALMKQSDCEYMPWGKCKMMSFLHSMACTFNWY